jgi:glycerol-3-phosphate dehydrogenase
VGEEICAHVQDLGVALPHPRERWYGEPGEEVRHEFLAQARAMDLDGMTSPRSSEKLASRLWRRYGAQAFGLLEDIRADPRMAEVLIEGAEYLRCELHHAARREMITKLEDFLRRRSKISLVIRHEDLASAPGLGEACRILFGAEADDKLAEYLRDHGPPAGAEPRSLELQPSAP